MKPTETHHLTRDEILKPPNWRPLRLRLEILFIRIIHRICDKFQPWQSPTSIANKFELSLALRTKRLQLSYKDWLVSNGPDTPNSQSTLHRTLCTCFQKKKNYSSRVQIPENSTEAQQQSIWCFPRLIIAPKVWNSLPQIGWIFVC